MKIDDEKIAVAFTTLMGFILLFLAVYCYLSVNAYFDAQFALIDRLMVLYRS